MIVVATHRRDDHAFAGVGDCCALLLFPCWYAVLPAAAVHMAVFAGHLQVSSGASGWAAQQGLLASGELANLLLRVDVHQK
jgi:hypothetical protein